MGITASIVREALKSPVSSRGSKVKVWQVLVFLFVAVYVTGFIVGAT